MTSTAIDVTLKLTGGRSVTFPISRLSQSDQDFIKEAAVSGDADKPADEADKGNFDSPWPDKIRFSEDPQIRVISEDKEEKRFIYESANYRFVCDVRLSQQVVKGFAVMFESTYQYCRALPLGLSGGKLTDGKYQILLFETKETYVEAGGPPSSAGVFMSGRGVVMVPLTSLGVRPVGSGYMLDRDQTSGTLIHEITHQLTPEEYFESGPLGWFSEGIAEYTTATPYRSGAFKVKGNFDDITDYATDYGKDSNGGRALGQKIKAPSLKDFFLMGYSQFAGNNANFNYGLGLLLTTYFLHLDGDGDAARMKDFLKALRAGEDGEDSLKYLLDGRTYEQLETAISKAWKRKGIDIEFGQAESSSDGDEDE
ncbi:hypothetical protein OKA04_20450 [Luteolibacter flavescens]|uniref:Peptidase MA-like domain-containing protein n=1 Tax=Luteolibacter flavescens TaxID=1859460 RepID=A0ABT3FV71_9BACT|nr:hypothetical protein [Luteolibacter flavescens]MCW1887121.1 hypothetical protein [Luteolibacter flavescens]